MNEEEFMNELHRIENSGVSRYEQGYQSAPALCKFTGCSVEGLLDTLEAACAEQGRRADFVERDKGAIAWCMEQLCGGFIA